VQTLYFTRALARIVKELKAEELISFLQPFTNRSASNSGITESQRDFFAALTIDSQIGYARLREDPQIGKILDALGVHNLYSPQRFGKMIRHLGNLQQTGQVFGAPDIFADFYSMSDSLLWLVNVKNACVELLETGKIPPPSSGNEIIELRLLDYDLTGVENERVQQFFVGLARLHAILSQFLNASNSQLKIAYFDSGSDLLVGFQCAKVLVDIMRGLFAEFWEKVKFQPFDDFEKKIGALSAGLSFVGQVKAQVDNQAISEADARVLTHRVLAEMATLVGIGASLPQDEVVEKVDNRKLLTEKRGIKLLGRGNDDSKSNS
jgi:hypothetical protein